MSLRTKSEVRQWGAWLVAALVAVAVYVVVLRMVGEGEIGNLLGPIQQRVLLPVLVALGFFFYETRWDGIVRKSAEAGEGLLPIADGKDRESGNCPPTEGLCAAGDPRSVCSNTPQQDAVSAEEVDCPAVSSESCVDSTPVRQAPPLATDETAESLYVRARCMKHQQVPDFNTDGDYLELLGRAAAGGHPKAQAKLGEYAMRRCAWVEAYYWMWQARRAGMRNLDPVLRGIRVSWATDGYPQQASNVHRLFSEKAGSIGRALLNLDSGREKFLAKSYLEENVAGFVT